MDETVSSIQNPVRDRILVIYLELCNNSATIRNIILSGSPGNKHLQFMQFKAMMYELYSLSYRYDRLNKKVVKKFNDWMHIKKTNPNNEFIIASLDLFDEYSKELTRNEIIKV